MGYWLLKGRYLKFKALFGILANAGSEFMLKDLGKSYGLAEKRKNEDHMHNRTEC